MIEQRTLVRTPELNWMTPGGLATASGEPLIRLRDVTKVYETAAGAFPALRGISAEIHAGEFIGIVGKSGAGKSTLVNVMTGVDWRERRRGVGGWRPGA